MPRSNDEGVTVRARDGIAGYAGLQHCGSVWSCPVDSASILTYRALEIGSLLGRVVEAKRVLGFMTLTMRHRKGQALDELWAAAAAAWGRATSGRQWVAAQAEHGVEGWVRVWEVTYGRNGWHVHVHLVLVLEPGSTAGNLDDVAGGMFARWSRGLVAAGLEAPRLVGQDWHLAVGEQASAQLAEYLFKLVDQGDVGRSLGFELSSSLPGRSRASLATWPVWTLLENFVDTGEVSELARWREWEKAAKGRRQVAYSGGLRNRYAIDVSELDDQAVVDQEMGSAEDDLVLITAEGWRQLVSRPAELPKLLEAAELGGRGALVERLDGLGVGYEVVRSEQMAGAPV